MGEEESKRKGMMLRLQNMDKGRRKGKIEQIRLALEEKAKEGEE